MSADETGLREALTDVLRIFDAPFATSPTTRANTRRRAERALAANPAPAGLDVERLAAVIDESLAALQAEVILRGPYDFGEVRTLDLAASILARLGSAAEDEEEEDR